LLKSTGQGDDGDLFGGKRKEKKDCHFKLKHLHDGVRWWRQYWEAASHRITLASLAKEAFGAE
jgi:hypothetical protein